MRFTIKNTNTNKVPNTTINDPVFSKQNVNVHGYSDAFSASQKFGNKIAFTLVKDQSSWWGHKIAIKNNGPFSPEDLHYSQTVYYERNKNSLTTNPEKSNLLKIDQNKQGDLAGTNQNVKILSEVRKKLPFKVDKPEIFDLYEKSLTLEQYKAKSMDYDQFKEVLRNIEEIEQTIENYGPNVLKQSIIDGDPYKYKPIPGSMETITTIIETLSHNNQHDSYWSSDESDNPANIQQNSNPDQVVKNNFGFDSSSEDESQNLTYAEQNQTGYNPEQFAINYSSVENLSSSVDEGTHKLQGAVYHNSDPL